MKIINKNIKNYNYICNMELKLTLEKALEAYNQGNDQEKKLLINLYGKEHFLKDIKDRVFDYKSACEELNYKPLTLEDFNFMPEIDRYRSFIQHQLIVQTRALNGIDYVHDFKDNKSKYYVYGYWNSDKKDYVLAVDCHWDARSFVGSAMLLKNRDLAEHAMKMFKNQYLTHHFNIK